MPYLCAAAERPAIVLSVKENAVEGNELKSYEINAVFRDFSVKLKKAVFLNKKKLGNHGDVYIFLLYLDSDKKIDQLCAFLRDEVDVVFAGRAVLVDFERNVVLNEKGKT